MESTKFDLAKFCQWGVDKALEHGANKTGLPLGEIVSPVANHILSQMVLTPIDVDPIVMMMGRLVIAGMDRNRKIEEAKKNVSSDSSML